jgi:hypothetical protein
MMPFLVEGGLNTDKSLRTPYISWREQGPARVQGIACEREVKSGQEMFDDYEEGSSHNRLAPEVEER